MGGKMRENAAEREPGGAAASWGGGEGTPGLKGSAATAAVA